MHMFTSLTQPTLFRILVMDTDIVNWIWKNTNSKPVRGSKFPRQVKLSLSCGFWDEVLHYCFSKLIASIYENFQSLNILKDSRHMEVLWYKFLEKSVKFRLFFLLAKLMKTSQMKPIQRSLTKLFNLVINKSQSSCNLVQKLFNSYL